MVQHSYFWSGLFTDFLPSAFPDAVPPVLVLAVCTFAFVSVLVGEVLLCLPVARASCCSFSCRISLSRSTSWTRLATIWLSVALTAARTNSTMPYLGSQKQWQSVSPNNFTKGSTSAGITIILCFGEYLKKGWFRKKYFLSRRKTFKTQKPHILVAHCMIRY